MHSAAGNFSYIESLYESALTSLDSDRLSVVNLKAVRRYFLSLLSRSSAHAVHDVEDTTFSTYTS